jgi:multisubunit Na+/H+ antiporter MnhE subunit
MPSARKVLLGLLVAFLVFYLVSRPESSADAVRTVLGAIGAAFGSVVVFFNSLAS